MSKLLKVGFCGAGNIVRGNHLPALENRSDRYQVIGFYDLKTENAEALAGNTYKVYPSYEVMLNDSEIDVVIIATKPLTSHFPTTSNALKAGKHVVLEKPMASTSQECDELIELAKSSDLILTVHHNRRLNLDFLALQDIIKSGKIGDPILIENRVCSGAYGGGDIVDWGVHLVDQSLLLNDSELLEISATLCNPTGGLDNCGYGEATFRFAKPPLVRMGLLPRPTEYLLNGTSAAVRFYATGTTGSFIQRTIECPNDMMNATQNFDKGKPEYAVPEYLRITQKEFYDYFYESMTQGSPLLVKPEQARNAIRALELMEISARENKTVSVTDMI